MATNKVELKKRGIKRLNFQQRGMTCCCTQKHQSPAKADAPGFILDGGTESDWSVDGQGKKQPCSADGL